MFPLPATENGFETPQHRLKKNGVQCPRMRETQFEAMKNCTRVGHAQTQPRSQPNITIVDKNLVHLQEEEPKAPMIQGRLRKTCWQRKPQHQKPLARGGRGGGGGGYIFSNNVKLKREGEASWASFNRCSGIDAGTCRGGEIQKNPEWTRPSISKWSKPSKKIYGSFFLFFFPVILLSLRHRVN